MNQTSESFILIADADTAAFTGNQGWYRCKQNVCTYQYIDNVWL